MNLNSISEARLRGVHPDLVRVVRRCARDWKDKEAGFIVTQGLRTMEEQRLLYKKGASRTLKSRHLTGHAVDLACSIKGQVRWDWPLYVKLSKAMKAAAKAEKIPIVWGGDWVSFRDGPHYELPRNKYPA